MERDYANFSLFPNYIFYMVVCKYIFCLVCYSPFSEYVSSKA